MGMKKRLRLNKLQFTLLLILFSCRGTGNEDADLSQINKEPSVDLEEVIERNQEGKEVTKYYIDNDSIIQGDVEYYYNDGSLKRKEFYIDGVIAGWATDYTKEEKVKSQVAYRYIKELNKLNLNEVRFFDKNEDIDINKSIEVRFIEKVNDSFQYGVLPFQTDSIYCFFFDKQFLVEDSLLTVGNTALIGKEYVNKIALFKLFQSDSSGIVSYLPVYKLIGDSVNTTLRTPDL